MHKITLVLACLACAGHGDRTHLKWESIRDSSYEVPRKAQKRTIGAESILHSPVGQFSPMAALARLFLALDPEAGFQMFGACRDHNLVMNNPNGGRASVVAQFAGSSARVAVFGGRGFIGSRVCRTLVEAGCDVVSVSLTDVPPVWAKEEPWVQKVQWLSVDSAQNSLGSLDAAISCVGNVRPADDWDGFFGLHWDGDTLEQQNGDVNEQIAKAAKGAGAQRFTYVSVSSDVSYAYGGALQGYIKGKKQGEEAVRRLFGDGAVIVGPSLVYGGGRFGPLGALYQAFTGSPPIKLLVQVLRKLNAISLSPQDRVNIIALSPPVDVETAARTIAAGALGSTSLGFINGSAEIERVAAEEAGAELLEAAATKLTQKRSPAQLVQVLAGAVAGTSLPKEGAASDLDAPFEGALVGARPFIFPVPIAVAFVALVLSFPRVPAKT